MKQKNLMFLIKAGAKKQFDISFQMLQNNLNITVIPTKPQKRLFKLSLNDQCLNSSLGAYFESMQEIFDFFRQQSSQTIDFKPDVQISGNQQKRNHILTFQILVGTKKKQKTLQLIEQLKQEQIKTAQTEMIQLGKIQAKKASIQQKKKQMKLLKQQITKLMTANKSKDQQMDQARKDTQQIKKQAQKKLLEIDEMRNQYKDKNVVKYQNLKVKQVKQQTVLNMAEELQSGSSSEIKSQASVIYEAMPDSYELCPLGKHVQKPNGKLNLFLKQKQITDSQIQSMMGFDWSEIQVLSLGANKITNRGINLLKDISDFENVIELYLFANPITNITTINFLPQLKKISFYELSLDQASCDHILKLNFPRLNEIYLDFDHKIRQKCWKKIIHSGLRNFPVLQSLHADHPESISQETKKKLLALCTSKNIQCQFGNPNIGLQNCLIY